MLAKLLDTVEDGIQRVFDGQALIALREDALKIPPMFANPIIRVIDFYDSTGNN